MSNLFEKVSFARFNDLDIFKINNTFYLVWFMIVKNNEFY